MRKTLLAAGMGLMALPAAAEDYDITDLAGSLSRESCVARARKVLNAYVAEWGGGDVNTGDWAIYGWDLRPGDQDVVFLCLAEDGDNARAVLVVHGGTDDPEATRNTADRLVEIWDR